MKQLKILVCAFACLKDPDTRVGFGKGGESELGWNMVLQISKMGEAFVLTDISNKELVEEKLRAEKISNIKFYYISLPSYLSFTKKIIQIHAYLWQIKAYFVARKLNKEFHFDFFHHLTYANDWMASYIGAFLPVKYVRGPGGGAHRVPKSFLKEFSAKEKISDIVRSAGQWIFRHDPVFIIGQNRAEVILVCNKEAFNALKTKWQKKVYLFPVNGISPEDLQLPYKSEQINKLFSVIMAGKLLKIKGFDIAIRAFAVFAEKNNGELIIVGDGPEAEALNNLARKLNLNERVRFEKWLPRKDLLMEIAKSDVFFFPSLRDGGGAVVVEAMAVGRPVVCFDISGPGFHIDESCGVKIKPVSPQQSVRDFAEALEKLCKNPLLRDSLGRKARQKAEDIYNWDKLGVRLKKIINNYLEWKTKF